MSEPIKVTPVQATVTAQVSTPAPAKAETAVAVKVDGDKMVAPKVQQIGAERAKLSPLQAPAEVRGSSRVGSTEDVLWGALMGALWADSL